MGSLLAKLKEMLFSKKLEMVLVGLDNCGKTTFANHLAYGEPKKALPTIGLNVRYAKKKSMSTLLSLRPFHENLGLGRPGAIKVGMAIVCKGL